MRIWFFQCVAVSVWLATTALVHAATSNPMPAKTVTKIPIAPLHAPITAFVPFDYAPFPYRGQVPDSGKRFLDSNEAGRRGHTSPRDGAVHWEDEIYKDNRVLLYLPQGFDVRKPALIVLFFHGNGATLSRDVLDRQQVAAQVAASGLNAALVAPQFAVDAADSSAGRFWQRGVFAKFIDEAGLKLAALYGDRRASSAFKYSRVVLVAYSGGYLPAAWALSVGKGSARLQGVILFDALYGQIDKFATWIDQMHDSTFFFSAFTQSTREQNEALKEQLTDANLRFKTVVPKALARGTVAFVDTGAATKHEDFMTQAWTQNPLANLLARIAGYPRTSVPAKSLKHSVPTKPR